MATRRQILFHLESIGPVSHTVLAHSLNHWKTGRAPQLYTQLHRMLKWGLVRRRWSKFAQRRGRRGFGFYLWRISKRGRERLAWYRTSKSPPDSSG